MIDLSKLDPILRKKIAQEIYNQVSGKSLMICARIQIGEIEFNDDISKQLDNLKEVTDQALEYTI